MPAARYCSSVARVDCGHLCRSVRCPTTVSSCSWLLQCAVSFTVVPRGPQIKVAEVLFGVCKLGWRCQHASRFCAHASVYVGACEEEVHSSGMKIVARNKAGLSVCFNGLFRVTENCSTAGVCVVTRGRYCDRGHERSLMEPQETWKLVQDAQDSSYNTLPE
jgi:hypothetical protein